MKSKSIKISWNRYRASFPKKRMALNASQSLCIIQHKGRWITALTEGYDREFRGCNIINRTEAIKIINFLSEYINLVKPTEATKLQASIKASTNRTVRTSNELTALAIGVEVGEL